MYVELFQLIILSDPATLVECAQFHSTGRIQPFSVTVSTSALLLIVSNTLVSLIQIFQNIIDIILVVVVVLLPMGHFFCAFRSIQQVEFSRNGPVL